jgi:hypothetical protein
MQAETQFSQPQHDPVAQSTQARDGSAQPALAVHEGAHCCVCQMHSSPAGHGSSSSQAPAGVGTHAARQSAQAGQLELAHSLQMLPAPQLAQKPSQAAAQVPLAKRHTPSGPQSA